MQENTEDLPKTRAEAISRGLKRYFTGTPCCNGHVSARKSYSGHCIQCVRDYENSPAFRERHKDRVRSYNRTPERVSAARERARQRLSTEEGRKKNRESVRRSLTKPSVKAKQREAQRRYFKTPKGKATIKRAKIKRRAAKLGAVPLWADTGLLNDFIDACPEGFHIDHIIPLQGDTVCGLHAVENLQYLPSLENCVKHNRIDPLSLEAVVCVLPEYRSYTRPRIDIPSAPI